MKRAVMYYVVTLEVLYKIKVTLYELTLKKYDTIKIVGLKLIMVTNYYKIVK